MATLTLYAKGQFLKRRIDYFLKQELLNLINDFSVVGLYCPIKTRQQVKTRLAFAAVLRILCGTARLSLTTLPTRN